MSLPRRAARAMLAGIFISGGLDQLRNPRPPADQAEPVITPLAERIGPLPRDPEQVVKLDGAIKVAAGVGMVVGPFARPSALVLAGSLVPTTLAGHRWWERQDPQQRANDKMHFFKNVAMLGGLLGTALDQGSRPSVPWMTRRAARLATATVGETAGAVAGVAGAVGSGVAHGAEAVADVAGAVGSGVVHGAEAAAETVGKAGKLAGKATGKSAKVAGKATGKSAKVAGKSAKLAGKATGRSTKTTGKAGLLAARTGAAAGEVAGKATGAAKTVGKTVGAILPG